MADACHRNSEDSGSAKSRVGVLNQPVEFIGVVYFFAPNFFPAVV